MIYHIINRSIADFVIFNDNVEYFRMVNTIRYYRSANPASSFSRFLRDQKTNNDLGKIHCINIIAYCLMPNHIHLMIKENNNETASKFINDILNSYTRYFNTKHKRKGPLWEGPSKKILTTTNEQLLHTTRYIHLNPVTAYLVNKPEDWPYSSYREYIGEVDNNENICKYSEELDMNCKQYKRFVEEQIPYQRELAQIKTRLTTA